MTNDNNKKASFIDGIKKKCVELWKVLAGVGVVIALIAGFYGLDAVVATEKDLDIYKNEVNAEFVQLKADVLATFQEIQKNQQEMLKNQQIQFLTQKYQEYLDKEMEFKYKLRQKPNDQDLKDQYNMWKSKREGAQKKLRELTGGTAG